MTSELKVIIRDDDAVGIIMANEVGFFTPSVAVEIACSLIAAAKDIDPSLDTDKVMKDYCDARGISQEVH